MRLGGIAMVLAACGGESSSDVVGPFTGTTHRFVVDDVALALDATMAMAIAADPGAE